MYLLVSIHHTVTTVLLTCKLGNTDNLACSKGIPILFNNLNHQITLLWYTYTV